MSTTLSSTMEHAATANMQRRVASSNSLVNWTLIVTHRLVNTPPFDLLATELVLRIFFLAVQDNTDSPHVARRHPQSFRRIARSVCHRWNAIVQACPQLEVWAPVVVRARDSDWQQVLSDDLTRLLSSNIHLFVDLRHSGSDSESLFKALGGELQSSDGFCVKSVRLLCTTQTVVNLQKLVARVVLGKRDGQSVDDLSREKKDVEELEVWGSHWSDPMPGVPLVLQSLTGLRRLSLQAVSFQVPKFYVPPVRITLLALKILIMDDITDESIIVLDRLCVPALETLAIRGNNTVGRGVFWLEHRLPSVVNVIIHNMGQWLDWVIILSSLPNVVNVSLRIASGHGGFVVFDLDPHTGMRPFASLRTLRIEGHNDVAAVLRRVLQNRLPSRLGECCIREIEEQIGDDGRHREQLTWLREHAGLTEEPAESFAFEYQVRAMSYEDSYYG